MHESCIIFSKKPLTWERLSSIMMMYCEQDFYDKFDDVDDIPDYIVRPEFLWDYWTLQSGHKCWEEDIRDINDQEDLFNIDISRATDKLGCCTFIDIDLIPHVHRSFDWSSVPGKWIKNETFKDELKEAVEKTKAVNGYFTILDYHW